MKLGLFLMLILISFSVPSIALDGRGQKGMDCARCHTLSVQEANELLKNVGGGVLEVRLAAVKGMWELVLENKGQKGMAFIDFGKKYVIPGPLFKISDLKIPQPREEKKIDFTKIPLENSIVMGNAKGAKKIVLFTDPDCPFCRKQHGEIKKLIAMEPDLAVYVKLFPLKMHPKAFDKSRVILGSKSLEVLDKAFSRAELSPLETGDSSDAVNETLRLGQSIGIEATPTIIMPDGAVLRGLREAATLQQHLSVNLK